MYQVFIIILAAMAATLFASVPARAESNMDGTEPDSIFMVGVYSEAGSSALIGKEQILPFPFIYYHNKYVTLETTNLYIHPFETGPFSLSAVGSVRLSNIETSSDDRFDDFDRSVAFEAGGRASFTFSDFSLYGQYLTDVTDAHGGEEITIGLEWEKQSGKFGFGFHGGASHRSSELATFLYGVTDKDTASGFTPFAVESGWYSFATANVSYALTDRWSILLSGSGERLPASTALSPIVGKRNELKIGTGVAYRF